MSVLFVRSVGTGVRRAWRAGPGGPLALMQLPGGGLHGIAGTGVDGDGRDVARLVGGSGRAWVDRDIYGTSEGCVSRGEGWRGGSRLCGWIWGV